MPITRSAPKFAVQIIPNKGRGLVATTDIRQGTQILSEAPIITDFKTITKGRVAQLSVTDRQLFRLLPSNPSLINWTDAKCRSIFNLNALPAHPTGRYNRIFRNTTLANHACDPNAVNTWNDNTKQLTLYAVKDILEGEEITISYLRWRAGRATRRKALQQQFAFRCRCDICTLPPAQRTWIDQQLQQLNMRQESLENAQDWSALMMLNNVYYQAQLCDETEDIVGLGRAYARAFEVVIKHGDRARAAVFANKAAANLEIAFGADNPEVMKYAALASDPLKHELYGFASLDWAAPVRVRGRLENPPAWGHKKLEKWLWRKQ